MEKTQFMEEPVIQKIVVILNFDRSDKILIENGIRLATIFSKGLILMQLYRNEKEIGAKKAKLAEYQLQIGAKHPEIPVLAQSLKGKGQNVGLILADRLEAIMVVAPAGRFGSLSKILRQSPIPFLFVNGETNEISAFKQILVPVDTRPHNKDSMLWPAFFARNNRSEVIALGANERTASERSKVRSNLASLKTLLKKSGAFFEIHNGQKGSLSIQFEALAAAGKFRADLLILLGSGYVTWFDLLIGLPEKKILKKAGGLPVLIVNPAKKNYLICD